MNRLRTSVVATTFMVVVFAADGCGGNTESAQEAAALKAATPQRVQPDGTIRLTDADRTALGLIVQSAAEADLPESTLRFGHVLSPIANEVQVVAPVTGRLSEAPSISLGSHVTVGAALMEVTPVLDAADRISIGTQSAQRDGEIDAAQRELTQAEAGAARARALAPQIVSEAKRQEAETAVATARARLEGLRRARAVAAGVQDQAFVVSAPIAGTVVSLGVTVGSLVKSGDVLARIVRAGPLWVDVAVPPDEPVGDRYEIVAGSAPIAARLLARGHLTELDGMRLDRLLIDGTDATTLTPGAAVSVRVGHGATRGVILPESALVPGVETDAVFVETTPGIFAARPVRVAARFGRQVRLASGIAAGDRVVTRGSMALEGELLRSQLQPAG